MRWQQPEQCLPAVTPVEEKRGGEITEAGIQMALHQSKLIFKKNLFLQGSNIPIGFYGKVIPVATILKHIYLLIMNGVLLYILSCVYMNPSNLHNSDYEGKWTFYGIPEGARCSFFLVSKTLTPTLQTWITPLLLGHQVSSFHSSVTL